MTRLPHFPDNRPLTDSERQLAAAVGQVRQQHDKKLVDTIGDVNLRKWCVEMAAKTSTSNFVAVAKEIYEFVCVAATKDEAR